MDNDPNHTLNGTQEFLKDLSVSIESYILIKRERCLAENDAL